MSPAIMGLIMIAIGFIAVFFISGFQIFDVLAPGQSGEATVILKQDGVCVVEASDNVPRQISNCPYEQGDRIVITYKQGQPGIENHRPV